MNEYTKDYVIQLKEDYIAFTRPYNSNSSDIRNSVLTGVVSLNNRTAICSSNCKLCNYYSSYYSNKVWECENLAEYSYPIPKTEIIYTNIDSRFADIRNPNNKNSFNFNVIFIVLAIIFLFLFLKDLFRR